MKTELDLNVDDIAHALTSKNSTVNFDNFKKRLVDTIVNSYSAPGRYYHNLEHVLKVVEAVSTYQGTESDKIVLKLAALFHDIVYDPRASDNEQKSAEWFAKIVSDTGISAEDLEKVKSLILLTKNHFSAKTKLEVALADADLSILAENSETYNEYASNIRKEYSHLEDELFFKRRLKFLKKIEERMRNRSLFFNLDKIYEEEARKNIADEILRLRHEK